MVKIPLPEDMKKDFRGYILSTQVIVLAVFIVVFFVLLFLRGATIGTSGIAILLLLLLLGAVYIFFSVNFRSKEFVKRLGNQEELFLEVDENKIKIGKHEISLYDGQKIYIYIRRPSLFVKNYIINIVSEEDVKKYKKALINLSTRTVAINSSKNSDMVYRRMLISDFKNLENTLFFSLDKEGLKKMIEGINSLNVSIKRVLPAININIPESNLIKEKSEGNCEIIFLFPPI